MQYRILGKTDLRVSEISLGAWSLGGLIRVRNRTSQDADPCGYCEVSEAEGIRMAHRALALGINLFDTAPIYGDGGSELRVRKALETSAARDVIVTAKCGVFAQDGLYVRQFTRDAILREVERSLKKLGTGQLDVEMLHSPSRAEFGNGECWKALLDLKAQGVVRHVGISINSEPAEAREFAESGLCDVMMLRINLLDTVMVPVLEIARKNNVGIMARESLSNGMLTGRFDENTVFGPDDQRSKFPRHTVLKRIRMAQQFKFLVREDRTLVQAAIQWVLSLAGVSTVTVGADTIPELEENTAASDMAPLTADELARISEIQGTS